MPCYLAQHQQRDAKVHQRVYLQILKRCIAYVNFIEILLDSSDLSVRGMKIGTKQKRNYMKKQIISI